MGQPEMVGCNLNGGVYVSNGAVTYDRRLEKLEKDCYYGNGKPGLCTRVEVAEGDIKTVEKRLDNIDKKCWALILLALTILGTEIADMVKNSQRNDQPRPSIHSYND